VSRDEAIAGLAGAHLFVVTSVKDLTSTVILEAMSQGVPVLCPDHCGFSDVVTPASGVKLSVGTPEVFVSGLRDSIAALFHDENRRQRLARGARERAKAFGPEAKAVQIQAVYESVLAHHGHAMSGVSQTSA
jgi:glycosyltransferase involved in cell wall biosynthesis